ncbi:MAG: TauD/TfdA family dioxygenase [Verrucomicrobiaceae bacterium]|nr:MAG: TauD/TfdA family dioxygenase [Verrucomicrobiaceae bacterium]
MMATKSDILKIDPLPRDFAFGAVVRGLTPGMIHEDAVCDELRSLWLAKGVLVFKDLPADPLFQIELSKVFGPLEVHPLRSTLSEEYPELGRIKQDPEDVHICRIGDSQRAGFLPWHKDLIYVDRINHGGILRAIQMPESGGYTGFLDQVALYETLPDDLKERIDGLWGVYRADFDPGNKRFGNRPETLRLGTMMTKLQTRLDQFSDVLHPLVFTHPEINKKVLNVSPWFLAGIDGLEGEEEAELLERLVAHSEADELAYFHHWQLGDMVLWDNWRVLHCAYGTAVDDRRWVERTTIQGDYEFGRAAGNGVATDAALHMSI